VNGLAAIFSRDPETLELGRTALREVCTPDAPGVARLLPGRARLVACGPEGQRDVARQDAEATGGRGAVSAVVSGEIVNATALARELALRPRDVTPGLLAIAAYRGWGAGLFTRLEGIFSLVVYDEEAGLALGGVDPRHIGSLFASRLGDDVWLASEARVFRHDPRFVSAMDSESFGQLFTQGWMVQGRSLFAGAAGLPLGTHFEVRDGTIATVRHDDDRNLCGGRLRGSAYLDLLEETMLALGAEAFAGGDVALPLTGGLDSRLLAAALPVGTSPQAFTFGGETNDDVRGARSVAAARGLDFQRFDLDPDYLPNGALATVRISEGRLSPAANITGCLMHHFSGKRSMVSGQGGELGRRFMKAVNLLPDRSLLRADPDQFVELAVRRAYRPLLDRRHLRSLLGTEADSVLDAGIRLERRSFAATAGLDTVDRLDLFGPALEFWESRPQLLFNRVWLRVRAPFHTRRWVSAVLAGAPSERVDDLVRLRLIRRLDSRVAAVPWTLTHLPLPLSEPAVLGLRQVARLEPLFEWLPQTVRDHAVAVGKHAKRRLYSHGEKREEWVRTRSVEYVRGVLLDPRCLERGIFREAGVRRLLDEQMGGGMNAMALGQMLNVELWHRLFVDGEEAEESPACAG